MSIHVLHPTPKPETTPIMTVRSNAFWPEIQPSELRLSMNIGDTVNDTQLLHAVIEAVALSNHLLKAWRTGWQAQGIEHVDQIDPDNCINQQTVLSLRYQRAVACFAKATTLEKYLDYDSSPKAEAKNQAKAQQVDLYWRDGHAAISDLLGLSRIQSELI